MGLTLREVVADDEFNEIIECEWTSYETPFNGFFQIYCPTTGTGPDARSESIKECTDRQLSWHKEDPTSRWLKVLDTESGHVVGGAQWNIYRENPYPNGVEHTDAYWWPEGESREFASMALRQCFNVADGRRSLLVDWGVKKADELGLEIFIEAAEPGVPLYLSHGFRAMDEFWVDPKVIDPSAEWKQLKEKIPPTQWVFMWKPQRSRFEEGKTTVPWVRYD
ncbi:MAG: hypothetical protein Q9182_005975 [Xanthomendoza sp. 2 TL-2023]